MIKLTFKHLLVVSMILTLFLGLSLVSATDVTDDNAVSTKNICTHSITSDNNDNIDVNDINNYAKNTFTSTSANNGSNSDENINNGNTVGDSNGNTIKDLKDKIDTGGSSITLDTDYTYNADTDSGLTGGIVVSRDLTIDGQGHTIDLGGKIRFLKSTTSGINLVLKNLIIKNGNAPSGDKGGGAVYIEGNGSFVNCTFTGNNVNVPKASGGAVYLQGNGNFINSTFTGNYARRNGGAVYIINGSGSFINSTFTGNNATTSGGAVYIWGGNGSFINSTFTNNTAQSSGGAVYIEGNCSFMESTFLDNNADDNGGAVYLQGNGNFINSTFTNNTAQSSGGAVSIVGGGNGNFINSTFTGNHAIFVGGAVTIGGGKGSFINSTFTGNYAKRNGGAVSIGSGNGSFINSTFTGNYAEGNGGAVYLYNGNDNFINSTFTDNHASQHGGAVKIESGNGTFINSIFTDNNAYTGGAVYIQEGNGSFINSTFTSNNATTSGGAVYIQEGNGSFINSTFTGNYAKGNGGAVFGSGCEFSVVNSIFSDNNADGGSGGAVCIENGNGIFINSTFTNNNGLNGGAIVTMRSNGSFVNCIFTGNNVSGMGGAIFTMRGNGSFINSTFTNNTAGIGGGAVYIIGNGSFINSTFTGNNGNYGGAIYNSAGNGSFINSTFTGNNAGDDGGAIYNSADNGTAILCRFNTENDNITNVDIIPASINVLNYTSTYPPSGKLEFNLTADDMVFDGLNTTINIFKDGGLVKTVYALTGEGWIVDLNPGVYTAVLSLTDYPAEKSSNATINISKVNTTVVIDPIVDAVLGKEVLINFTTNSNGTATIKVNGEDILDSKFTPTQAGTYNVTVAIAENDYYTAGSAETTFNVEKINTTVVIDPIVDAVLGKEVLINFTTNSNGTATIKVNGVPINSATFTPTQAGTYNVTVEVAENDYYTAGSAETNFTVEKINTTVVIDPIVDAILGKEVLINFTTNSNGTATIKVNGVPINNATFTPTQAGTYNVTVEVAENDYYTAGSAETNFTVEKLASSIIADAVSTTYTVDKFLVISLKDSNGNPISGADLSVNLRGIKNYTTNENGQVLINVAKLYPKTYNAMISYEGSDNFNGSTGSAKVTVNKITSTIIAKSPTFKLNQNIKKYTITLKYLSGKLLANKKVVLNFNGKTYTVKTNNKGQGVFKIYKHLKKGVYNAVITVPENSYYNKVIKKVKITVK